MGAAGTIVRLDIARHPFAWALFVPYVVVVTFAHCVGLTSVILRLTMSEILLRCGMFAIVPIMVNEIRYDTASQRGLRWQEGGGYEAFE